MRLLDSALHYVDAGHPVLPLNYPLSGGRCSCGRPACERVGKHPYAKNGFGAPRGLLSATLSEEQVKSWWEREPSMNVGLRCDALIVLDVDRRAGGHKTFLHLKEQLRLPPTTLQVTAGGYHVLYHAPAGEHVRSVNALYDGIDLRAEGGYIVAAPSLHATGHRYHYTRAPMVEAPDSLLYDLQGRTQPDARGQHLAADGETIAVGKRYATFFYYASSMRRCGMTPSEILAALLEVNRRAEEPLPPREIEQISASMARYAPSEIAARQMQVIADACRRSVEAGLWEKLS